jgi:hypothetical protein
MTTVRRKQINDGFCGTYTAVPTSGVVERLTHSGIDIKLDVFLLYDTFKGMISSFEFIPDPISFEITGCRVNILPRVASPTQGSERLLRGVTEFLIQSGNVIPRATCVICNTYPVNTRILPNTHKVLLCFGRESAALGGRLYITTRIPKENYSPQTLWANLT